MLVFNFQLLLHAHTLPHGSYLTTCYRRRSSGDDLAPAPWLLLLLLLLLLQGLLVKSLWSNTLPSVDHPHIIACVAEDEAFRCDSHSWVRRRWRGTGVLILDTDVSQSDWRQHSRSSLSYWRHRPTLRARWTVSHWLLLYVLLLRSAEQTYCHSVYQTLQ